jgi:hypothetical protein
MNLCLRAMVNAAPAIYSQNSADKVEYANECLDLATMMHEQAPDDETTWLVEHAQELKNKISAQVEQYGHQGQPKPRNNSFQQAN